MRTSLFHYLKNCFPKYKYLIWICFFHYLFINITTGQDCVEGYGEITPDTLNGTYGFTLNGINTFDLSGSAVSTAGDFNNDGFSDMVVGAQGVNSLDGEAYVIYGGVNITTSLNLNALNGTNGFIIQETANYDSEVLGHAVSTAGDFNNDGFDDVIIGAHLTQTLVGAAYIIYGQNSINSPFDLTTLNGSNGFVVYGVDYDSFGFAVNSIGDFNNDGFDDVIIGAVSASSNGNNQAGKSYVIFGTNNISSPFDLNTLNGNNGFLVEGLDASDYLGFSGSTAGDVNNDGFDDVIISARRGDPNGIDGAGECYVIYGRANINSPFDLNTLNGNNGFIIHGINESDGVGESVSTAGDINNDGFDDIIIGARYHDECYVVYGGNNIGNPFELGSLNGNNGFVITDQPEDGGFGDSVSGAGDVNNDGFDDLIIGSFFATANGINDAGKSYVIYGGTNISHPFNVADINGNNAFVINGIDASDNLGTSVRNAGDINNDSFDDIIIGASEADPNGIEYAGETYVIYGNCGCNIEANIVNLPNSTFATAPISLTANPPGGQFSGNGVIFSAFNPSIAGPGFHTITYQYTAPNGCEAVVSSTILVGTITYNFVNYNLGIISP